MRLVWYLFVIALSLLIAACNAVPIPTSDLTPTRPAPGATTAAPNLNPTGTAQPFSISLPNPLAPPTATPLPKPHVLRINLGTRPDVLDPQKASTTAEIAVVQLAYEGLTRVDEKGRVVPGAASSWEFGADGKTLTFHLRNTLVRADGTAITAKDFEYAFKRAVDPRVQALDPSLLDDVHGALAAYSLDPKSKPEDIQKALDNVGVKATDDATLVVTFDQPTGYWPTLASTWVGFPAQQSKINSDPDGWWIKPENHNGNGPFKITEMQDQVIKLVPNPNYWGGKSPLDRLELYWIAEPGAALEAYRKGQVDVVRAATDTLATIQADPALAKELVRAPAPWVTYLGFNVKKAPFTDKKVRQAFSQALDREGFVHEVLKGLGQPYLSWIPIGLPGYDETASAPGYDAQGAVKTLVEAGYGTPDKKRVDCNKLGTVKLSYSNTPRYQTLFGYLAANLTRVFACPVLLDPVDPSTYPLLTKDPKNAPQMYLITWQEEFPHPQNWLFLQTCTGVYATRIGYCNKDFDAALAAANAETDFDKSMDKYRAAQRIFVGDTAGAFLWNQENAYLIKPYVRGVWDHHSTADTAFPGQFGPVWSFDVDTARVGAEYPSK